MKKYILSLILCVLNLSLTLPVSASEGEIAILRQRLLDDPYIPTAYQSTFYDNLNESGVFSDLNYESNADRAKHIERLVAMSWEYKNRTSNPIYQLEQAKDKIINALEFFADQEYTQVGMAGGWSFWLDTPIVLTQTLLIMEQEVSASLYDKVKQSYLLNTELPQATNFVNAQANLSWKAKIYITRGVLENDDQLIKEAYRQTGDYVMSPHDGEGIKPDLSFHAHGPLPYGGGYGRVFLLNMSSFVRAAAGTEYQYSTDVLEKLVKHFLQYYRWIVYEDITDFNSVGRQFLPPAMLNGGYSSLINMATAFLAEDGIPYQQELIDILNQYNGNGKIRLSGNRYYWNSDLAIHRRDDYYVSFRTNSDRTIPSESVNGEGLKNYYMGDGSTTIMKYGDEYGGIFPVWDWRRIPGTTVLQEEGDLPTLASDPRGNSFTGGISDGSIGTAMMTLDSDKVTAKKSVFFFNEGIVALGSDINSTADYDVYTSVNQCNSRGKSIISDGDTETDLNSAKDGLNQIKWAHHGDIGYMFFDDNNIIIEDKVQTGKWTDIVAFTASEKPSYADDMIQKNVFSIYYDHGKLPEKASYAYAILPNISVRDMDDFSKSDIIQILRNDEQIQAVWHEGEQVVQAVFYRAGQLEFDGGSVLTVDKPCVIMAKRENGGYSVSASNPENTPLELNISISVGEVTKNLSLLLPDEPNAGSTALGFIAVSGVKKYTFYLGEFQYGNDYKTYYIKNYSQKNTRVKAIVSSWDSNTGGDVATFGIEFTSLANEAKKFSGGMGGMYIQVIRVTDASTGEILYSSIPID